MPPSRSIEGARLSIIAEDSDAVADQPRQPRTSHRPFNRRWADDPPLANYEASPPEYDIWDGREKRRFNVFNHTRLVRRGGWKRLGLILLITIVIIIALGVGLGVGLSRRNQSENQTYAC